MLGSELLAFPLQGFKGHGRHGDKERGRGKPGSSIAFCGYVCPFKFLLDIIQNSYLCFTCFSLLPGKYFLLYPAAKEEKQGILNLSSLVFEYILDFIYSTSFFNFTFRLFSFYLPQSYSPLIFLSLSLVLFLSSLFSSLPSANTRREKKPPYLSEILHSFPRAFRQPTR